MKLRELLDQWSLTGLKINVGFLEAEFKPSDRDRDAAWDMYVELLTRVTTHCLPAEHGDEATALSSVHALFGLTRDILRNRGGRHATEFAKIAIVVLNQKVRPFTTRWHKASLAGAFSDAAQCARFRAEFGDLQQVLVRYAGLLAALAGVEDLTRLEQTA